MSINVDNTVASINYKGSDIATAYIGATLVYPILPPIIDIPTMIDNDKLAAAVSSSTDPVFKRSLTPLVGTVTDISVGGDKSVLFKNNRWYSQHSVVLLGELCPNTFAYLNYITHIDLRGLDTSRVSDTRGMFVGLPKIVEIDLSEMDTSNVKNMSSMFLLTTGGALPHYTNIKYGPKFVPTALSSIQQDSTSSTYMMFGNALKETDPNYQYQLVRPWNPNNWVQVRYPTDPIYTWVYTSRSV